LRKVDRSWFDRLTMNGYFTCCSPFDRLRADPKTFYGFTDLETEP